jgi:hypothetical protein
MSSYKPGLNTMSYSPFHFDDMNGNVYDQFRVPFPGFPGSELDFVPHYNIQDETATLAFAKQQGVPAPTHLANVHQPVDAFLGSYRDFEVYQSGCYPHKDARVYSHRRTNAWVPGSLESGHSMSTMLDFTKHPTYPIATHGTSLSYAHMNPDLY